MYFKSEEQCNKFPKKILKCIDCGLEFEVDKSVKRKNRCDECYEKYRREKVVTNVENYRKRKCNQL